MKKNGVLLRGYLLPDSGVHEAREVARVGGAYGNATPSLLDVSGLGCEDRVGVQRRVWGGRSLQIKSTKNTEMS